MNMNQDPRSDKQTDRKKGRRPYQPPAIIYEGKITVRAGTGDAFPFQDGLQDGPGLPFDNPSSNK